MKPTQVTELFATIKKTFVSFFSIFMFVALGVGVFLGISWAGPALQDASDNMFREGQFHNFQIQFPLGLTDDDLQKLGDVEGVTNVEGAHQSFQGLKKDGINNTVKVQSLGQHIDVPLVLEGELPSAPNEMAFHMESARMLGVRVGDSITFEHDAGRATDLDAMTSIIGASSDGASAGSSNTSGMKYLMSDTFKVTAIIDTAEYVSTHTDTFGYSNSSSGAVDAIAWVPDAAFDASAFQNGFPIVNVTCESLSGMGTLSDEYKDASAKIEGRITTVGDTLGQARFESVTSDAKAKLEDAEKQLAEGKQKIIDGEKQLASGRIELATQKADGEKRLADAYALLQSYESQRAQGAEDLEWARSTVSQGESALATADSAKAEVAAIAADASAYKAQQDELRARGDINLYEYNTNLDAYAANLTARLMSQASLVGQGVPIVDHTNYDVAVSTAYSLVDPRYR